MGEHEERRPHRVGADAGEDDVGPARAHGADPGSGGRGVSRAGPGARSTISAKAPAAMPASGAERARRGGRRRPRRRASPPARQRRRPRPPGDEVMVGTSSTRNTSGTAKSSGSDSGRAEPMRTPMTVQTCQLPQSSSGGAEVVGQLAVEPGGGRAAGGRVVRLLRPPGDRHRVGLVGEQVRHEEAAASAAPWRRAGPATRSRGATRRLIVQAAMTATSAVPPSASASAAASCEAPAKTMVERPMEMPPAEPVGGRRGPRHEAERDDADEHRRHRLRPRQHLGAGGRVRHRCIMPCASGRRAGDSCRAGETRRDSLREWAERPTSRRRGPGRSLRSVTVESAAAAEAPAEAAPPGWLHLVVLLPRHPGGCAGDRARPPRARPHRGQRLRRRARSPCSASAGCTTGATGRIAAAA